MSVVNDFFQSADEYPVVWPGPPIRLTGLKVETTMTSAKNSTELVSPLGHPAFHQWPLLLTWFNFNPSMDK